MPITPFMHLFGRSPIGPLEAHMSKVATCVQALTPFFAAAFQEDWATAETAQKKVSLLENEADDLKRDLRLHLPKGLFLSVSRSDLLALLTVQDCLANRAKDIAGVVFGRRMIFPEKCLTEYQALLAHCIDAATQADQAIHELDELLETGFSGNEIRIVEDMIAKLSQIERETDAQQISLRNHLFSIEDSLSPVHVVFLYRVIEWTGDIADYAQEVGNRLQILLAR
ncbi:MAG: TIGR00153 family protein [Gammaproteobacteria bacterium]|nr:TIGR00153 family protein [Gammaproteobacteria bacterium]